MAHRLLGPNCPIFRFPPVFAVLPAILPERLFFEIDIGYTEIGHSDQFRQQQCPSWILADSMHENSEGIIKIYGGIALDAICDSVICRHHTCNVQCCRGRKEKRVLPNKVGDLSYVVELSTDLGLLSVFTFEYHGAPISFGTEHPQHFLPHLVGIDTEPVLVAVFVFGDEFDIERRWLFCAFVIQQKGCVLMPSRGAKLLRTKLEKKFMHLSRFDLPAALSP